MCFSEGSSFGIAAALAPAGLYGMQLAWRRARGYLVLASFPLAFACQQACEGLVWHGLNTEQPALTGLGARGFVAFSHGFWLFYTPLAAWALETQPSRKRILGRLAAFGGAYGASLALPLLVFDWLTVETIRGSIEYHTQLIYDGLVPRPMVRVVYALVIVSALLISSDSSVRRFGFGVLATVVFAAWRFPHAFISVWCFLAAAVSVLVVWIVRLRAAGVVRRESGSRDAGEAC